AILNKLRAHPDRARAIRALVAAAGDPEVPFGLRLGNWFVSGRFDKLLRCDPGWEVIDWKTDADQDVDAIVARHTPQMRLYGLALWRANLAHLVKGSVRVHLALLGPLAVHTLSFTTDELEVFARELEEELRAMMASGA
ncbi:MAG: PD-(D/E)XK nuclease family protein, partial [Gemmataceae bacterium]